MSRDESEKGKRMTCLLGTLLCVGILSLAVIVIMYYAQ